jgi:hypothetical protein
MLLMTLVACGESSRVVTPPRTGSSTVFEVGLQDELIPLIGLSVLFVSVFGITFLGLLPFGGMRPVLSEVTEPSDLPSAGVAPETRASVELRPQ